MYLQSSRSSLFLLALCLVNLLHLSSADYVDPYPASDCSQGIGIGQAACPNQPGCCYGGAACCAGGCCPMTAYCVNMGAPDEGCCPLDDPTNCGVAQPTYTLPACGGAPRPSVQCVGADDDWYCPPGNTCGSTYGSCFGTAGDCTTPVADADPTDPTDPSATSTSGGDGDSASTDDSESNEASRAALYSRWLLALGTIMIIAMFGFAV